MYLGWSNVKKLGHLGCPVWKKMSNVLGMRNVGGFFYDSMGRLRRLRSIGMPSPRE